ncbi:MAG TPA: universal stress protein [Sphingobacteriaceae bacterium]
MKTILVMTDFSARAGHAAEEALRIAERTGSDILLFNLFFVPAILPAESGVYPYYEEYGLLENEVGQKLEQAAAALKRTQGAVPVRIATANRPLALGEDIFDSIDRSRTWLIVMGSKARNGRISDLVLGSLASDVVERAFCPVLLVPETVNLQGDFKIAFASNLEPSEDQAIAQVGTFAGIFGAGIVVIHVDKNGVPETERLRQMRNIEQVTAKFHYLAASYQEIESPEVAATLAELTRTAGVRVLAVVHRKLSFFTRLFGNSVTRELLNYRQAMLLVLPEAKR